MTLKQKLYRHCEVLINDKINHLQHVLSDLKESSANETKSTAGDKHETALAMLQIEQANTRAQLEQFVSQKNALEKINPELTAGMIVNGSLVKTDKGYLYISIALGKQIIEGLTVITLSPQSPLGAKLMGLKTGDLADLNKNKYVIESIE